MAVAVEKSQFAVRLREWRAKRKLTQEGLARAAGLTLAAVRKLEREDAEKATLPSWDTAKALARALNVSLDKLAEEM